MMYKQRLCYLFFYLIALAACQNLPLKPENTETNTEFIILYDNDHHGHFLPNKQGEYGMAARKTLVDRIRRDAGDTPVFYFSAGDINTGTAESRILEAEPDIIGMNHLKVDAMAIGNHELDLPLSSLKRQAKKAQFPMLSANMYAPENGRLYFPSHRFFERGGIKLGVLGLTTPDTRVMVHPNLAKNLGFHDPVATAKTLVPELKQKADIVIALTHLGHYPDGQHGLNAVDDVTLARQVQGIDVIIGGHTQTAVCMLNANERDTDFKAGDSCQPDKQGDAWIVQAEEWGKYLGKLTLKAVFDNKGTFKRVEFVSNRLIPVNLKDKNGAWIGEYIPHDPKMTALFDAYLKKSDALMNKRVSHLVGSLTGDRSVLRHQDSMLAQLVLASQIDQVHADLGIINGGGLRDGIAGGDVTMSDVWRVLPFETDVVVYRDLTGKELKDYLAKIIRVASDSGGYRHFRGVQFRKNSNAIDAVVVTGQTPRQVIDHECYRVVTNSFLALGGDHYPILQNYTTTQTSTANVFAQYLAKHKQIKVADYTPQPFLLSAQSTSK